MNLMFLTLDLVKSHLRIDTNLEDSLLTMYASSAEHAALNFCQRSVDSFYEEYGEVPVPVIQACLVRVGTAYKYREDVTDRNLYRLPYTWENLLVPYIPADKI